MSQNEPVTFHETYEAFETVADPEGNGFVIVKPGFYCRAAHDDFFHTLQISGVKGGAFVIYWGLSLRYLPLPQRRRLRWHRTLKSSRSHLFESAPEYVIHNRLGSASDYYIETIYGHSKLMITSRRVWSLLGATVHSWFQRVKSLEDVLRIAEDHIQRDWGSVGHNPDPRISLAFTLAKLGRLEEARSHLALYEESNRVSEQESQLLLRALNSAYQIIAAD